MWAHVFIFILWCDLLVLCFYVSWTCPTAQICLTVLLCQASRMTLYHFTDYTFGIMYAEWLIPMAFDNRYSMKPQMMCAETRKWTLLRRGLCPWTLQSSWTSLGSMPLIPGFRWSGLSGDSSNMVRVLVPDENAEPVGFHNVLVENLSNTPDYHVKPVYRPGI